MNQKEYKTTLPASFPTAPDVMSNGEMSRIWEAYRFMLLARAVDEKHLRLLKQGKSFFHIGSAGHEAVQVAAAFSLRRGNDWAFPYYRDLAFVLAYGMTPEEVFLGALHRAADPSSGARQMPSHWGKRSARIVTQSSPTGTQFLQAVGVAEGLVRDGQDEIVYVSSGEGTTSEGEFFEALNWASRRKLPVLFCIEDNKYAISVPVTDQTAGGSISRIVAGFPNLRTFECDGTDFLASYRTLTEAVQLARLQRQPVLVHAHVVRLFPHSSSDDQRKYRNLEELEREQQRDPLEQMKALFLTKQWASAEEIETLRHEIIQKVENAAQWAEAQEIPEPSTALSNLYAPTLSFHSQSVEENMPGEKIVLVDAINHALREEMERNERIIIFGQDVADPKGGVFTATKGLSSRFGEERVFNAPLAEASIIGVAIGLALEGWRPVVEIQFGDYIWPAFNQLRNELSTIRYRSNGDWSAPVVVRVPVGGYIHGGIYHSQSIESFFAHIPGLRILFPSTAADAKGLLKAAMRSEDPVLFLEHKGLYRQSYAASPEPSEDFVLPLGTAAVRRKGADVSVITYGATVHYALDAARTLEANGVEVEVIDLRTLNPLDEETIFQSVRKTNRVLVVHEDSLTAGFGAELISRISQYCFEYLDAPPLRVAAEDVPVPYSPTLEAAVLPSKQTILLALEKLLRY